MLLFNIIKTWDLKLVIKIETWFLY